MHRRRSGCDTICSTCFRAIIFLHSVLLLCSRMRELAEAASIDDLAVNRKHGNQTCDLLRSFPEHEMASRLCLYSVSTILQSRRTKPRTSPCSSRMSWYGLWKVNEPEDLMSRQESLLGNRADLTPFGQNAYGFEKTGLGWMVTGVSLWRRWYWFPGQLSCETEVATPGLEDILDFPSWSSSGHMCWRCNCTKSCFGQH